jgi:phage gpG-like protein
MQLVVTLADVRPTILQLAEAARRVQDWRPVLQQFGVHMVRSVQQTFDAGGRPTPWPPSLRVLIRGGKTLIKTARLKNSVVAEVEGARVLRIGSNVRYAAVHQLGFDGVVQIPAHLRRVKSRDLYQAPGVGRAGRRTRGQRTGTGFAAVKAHPAHLRIPARPYLVVQPADAEVLRDLAGRHMTGGRA